MFVDSAVIEVKAGNGGHGALSFRREKYSDKGGPDGGDGGHGGDVIFFVDTGQNTLIDFAGRHHWAAENGKGGQGKKMTGKSGQDRRVPVPPGTEIYDLGLSEFAGDIEGAEKGVKIADLTEVGQELTIARGGKGGLGNWHFKSSTNQTPRQFTEGTPGEFKHLRLELKLIADVGLAGFPNAGKSTLLSAVSSARPKVADYPFTTLEPKLGIAELDEERRLVIADIPGLISGASEGHGLGHDFLRHIERCQVILHVVDVLPPDGSDPAENYKAIRHELAAFSPKLAERPSVIAANKTDLLMEDDDALEQMRQKLPGQQIIPISGATRQGIPELLNTLWSLVRSANV